MTKKILIFLNFIIFSQSIDAQHSIARQWNEKVLEAIRADFARPTVHARNLFHTSAAMYDAWAVYEPNADTYFLGKTVHGYTTPMQDFPLPDDPKAAQEEAISYAVFRLITHRFYDAPRAVDLFASVRQLMEELGYDADFTSTDYICSPAAMGNYIAENIIAYGLQDGANETGSYENKYYIPVNPPLIIEVPGNPDITNFNRWQPLQLMQFIDQSGTPLDNNIPEFLSPEWGQVAPFSLQESDAVIYERDGFEYKVYHDPDAPPYLNTNTTDLLSEEYIWGHTMVGLWSSHLDPTDGVLWDISPATIGNITDYPTTIPELRDFYNAFDGGDPSAGHDLNPKTGQPYAQQVVPRADYARVLAEFWADGPDSETPPGHWFTILNYVNDQPELVRRFRGEGEVLSDLEWDIKAYFTLGGTMHDVAISVWGIKGWYDYVRPVSAIRGMAELGQSSDPTLPNYHVGGLPLIPDFVELIEVGDPLQGINGQHVNELKIKAWKGPGFISDPDSDVAGVDWVRATFWFPYQRPSFVTPPFAGYVSGHSAYSRAAAEVLTAFTGDAFFPGGMGEFFCPKNEFLVFENGPSVNVTLQWATYRDASDQCSLSRIWGGIHPPCDDISARLIGERIGIDAFNFATQFFTKNTTPNTFSETKIFPNPAHCIVNIDADIEGQMPIQIIHRDGKLIQEIKATFADKRAYLDLSGLPDGVYFLRGIDVNGEKIFSEKLVVY